MNNSSISQNRPKSPEWQILGAGSMGLLWAAALLESDLSCSLVLKPEKLARYPGFFQFTGLNAVKKQYNCAAGDYQAIASSNALLVATKATDTIDALLVAREFIQPDCKLLLLQNGMGIQQQVCQMFPENPVFCAVMSHGAWRPAEFELIHAGDGYCRIGALQKQEKTDDLPLPAKIIKPEAANDIEFQLWKKLLVNAVINPLTVKYRCNNGELEHHWQECCELLDENIRIASSCGNRFNTEEQQQLLLTVIRNTAGNCSSMLADVQHQRETEIDFINGYLLTRAEETGIDCPINRVLVNMAKTAENR